MKTGTEHKVDNAAKNEMEAQIFAPPAHPPALYNLRMRRVILFGIWLAASGVGGAQTAQKGVNARLVEISVVAHDKNGAVADLGKNDFTILDNGKPRRIDAFAVSDSRNRKPASPGAMPAGVASNIRNAAGEVAGSATVILFDMMNSSNDGGSRDAAPGNATNNAAAINRQNEAVKQLVGYLRTIRGGERVALFVLGYQLHVIQDFTGEGDVLLRAGERLKELDQAAIEVSTQAQLAVLLEPPQSWRRTAALPTSARRGSPMRSSRPRP